MRLVRSSVAVLGSITLIFGLAATAAAVPTKADPCGFFKANDYAYYNNCAKDPVEIEVTSWSVTRRCVGPGTTAIGMAPDISNARATGRAC